MARKTKLTGKISIVLVIAMLITAVVIYNPFKPASTVQAEQYRKGFSLVPIQYDSTGVKTDSTFILKQKEGISRLSLEYLARNITIEGMEPPLIEILKDNSFRITPAKELQQNRLYTFRLLKENGEEVTWTFQTTLDFAVLGSLPENTGTNVPVETGVEIYFTHSEFKIADISGYFEITPSVEGTFEKHGYAAVFVPKKLEYGTLYTVNVKKGLPLEKKAPYRHISITIKCLTSLPHPKNRYFLLIFM